MTEEHATYTVADDGFRIDSLPKLEWYGRKRASLLADMKALAARYIECSEQMEAELKRLDERFMAEARDFAHQQLAGEKTKTLKTLGGNWSFRAVPGGIRKRDAKALVAWAKRERPELVDTRTEIREDVSAETLRLYFEATGEIPDGAEYVPDTEAFTHKG